MDATATISDDDRRLLIAHYQFYEALDTGSRAPTTVAQRHFVAVCRGAAPPQTEHEWAYTRLKQAISTWGINEADMVASGFAMPPELSAEDLGAGDVIDVPVQPCVGCGRPIPPERMDALPETTRCVSCQQRSESAPTDLRVSEILCPRCAARGFQSRMVWRTARNPTIPGYFLGCSRYPECRYMDRS